MPRKTRTILVERAEEAKLARVHVSECCCYRMGGGMVISTRIPLGLWCIYSITVPCLLHRLKSNQFKSTAAAGNGGNDPPLPSSTLPHVGAHTHLVLNRSVFALPQSQ